MIEWLSVKHVTFRESGVSPALGQRCQAVAYVHFMMISVYTQAYDIILVDITSAGWQCPNFLHVSKHLHRTQTMPALAVHVAQSLQRVQLLWTQA